MAPPARDAESGAELCEQGALSEEHTLLSDVSKRLATAEHPWLHRPSCALASAMVAISCMLLVIWACVRGAAQVPQAEHGADPRILAKADGDGAWILFPKDDPDAPSERVLDLAKDDPGAPSERVLDLAKDEPASRWGRLIRHHMEKDNRSTLAVQPSGVLADGQPVDGPRVPAGFQRLHGGVDGACLGVSGTAPSDGDFDLHEEVDSLEDCADLCKRDAACMGIEYESSASTCKVLAGAIADGTRAPGVRCLRRNIPGFETADSSENRSCNFNKAVVESGSRSFYMHDIGSAYECQARCAQWGPCVALEYDGSRQRCELSPHPVSSTEPADGVSCLRYHNPAFDPVDGNEEQICTQHEEDRAKESKFPPQGEVATLGDCQARCARTAACTGIQHHNNSCLVFTLPITGGVKIPGAACLRHDPAAFLDQGRRGAEETSCLVEGGSRPVQLESTMTMYECKASCARTDFCQGIEYFEDEVSWCHLVMDPISGSKEKKGSRCLVKERPESASLFCFTLMLPWTDEPKLLSMQFKERWGIFACDQAMVYSNPAGEIGGIATGLLDTDLHCEMGGPPGLQPTVLNTPVFEKLWEKVIEDAHFRAHDWVVKADPDTVFFPERIRQIVRTVPQDHLVRDGMFLKNCKLGLHGPIEVISRRAVEIYATGSGECERPGQEDVFMESCLTRLGVYEHMQENVLAEGECMRGDFNANPLWYFCNTSHAAFHPLKTKEQYKDCQRNAEASKFKLPDNVEAEPV